MAKSNSKKKEQSSGRFDRVFGSTLMAGSAGGAGAYRHVWTKDKKHTPLDFRKLKILRSQRKYLSLLKEGYKQSRGLMLKPSFHRNLRKMLIDEKWDPAMIRARFGQLRTSRRQFKSNIKQTALIGAGFYGFGKYAQYKANKRGK